ncbi:MAG TPA: hypothetical protein PKD53_17185 [Chloroflexaceae bacterium]|nr:hypothetical protein [Chloroflexaceae bacterium]
MAQRQLMHVGRLAGVALVALLIVFGGRVGVGQAGPQAASVRPMLVAEVFDVNCTSLAAITPTYARLANLATFTVQSPDSTVELTFNGRIFVGSFASGTGAVFELRVDDAASTVGRARANLRAAQAGGGGVQTSITGLFTGLPAGEHTASMWVRTSAGGAGTQAMVDPGCWSTDVLIVKEHTPLGFTHLPAVSTP